MERTYFRNGTAIRLHTDTQDCVTGFVLPDIPCRVRHREPFTPLVKKTVCRIADEFALFGTGKKRHCEAVFRQSGGTGSLSDALALMKAINAR